MEKLLKQIHEATNKLEQIHKNEVNALKSQVAKLISKNNEVMIENSKLQKLYDRLSFNKVVSDPVSTDLLSPRILSPRISRSKSPSFLRKKSSSLSLPIDQSSPKLPDDSQEEFEFKPMFIHKIPKTNGKNDTSPENNIHENDDLDFDRPSKKPLKTKFEYKPSFKPVPIIASPKKRYVDTEKPTHDSPSGFWSPGFPSTQKVEEARELKRNEKKRRNL